jgi:hypothetical protein
MTVKLSQPTISGIAGNIFEYIDVFLEINFFLTFFSDTTRKTMR